MFEIGDRIERKENRETIGGEIIEIINENCLITYDEGGQGWWPWSELELE